MKSTTLITSAMFLAICSLSFTNAAIAFKANTNIGAYKTESIGTIFDPRAQQSIFDRDDIYGNATITGNGIYHDFNDSLQP